MKFLNSLGIIISLLILHSGSLHSSPAILNQSSEYVGLVNGIIDEAIHWAKEEYIYKYDPLTVPPVNQDDLNMDMAIAISEIQASGLSNIFRLADVQVHGIEISKPGMPNSTEWTYLVTAKFGVRNIGLHFRIEVLKLLSLNFVDFVADGSLPGGIDIPIEILVTPSTRALALSKIAIENIENMEVNVKYQSVIGGWIPFLDSYVKNKIKSSIKEAIDSKLGEGKEKLNALLNAYATRGNKTQQSTPPAAAITTIKNVTQITPFSITLNDLQKSNNGNLPLVVKYKSSAEIGKILIQDPKKTPAEQLNGYYDATKKNFVLNYFGKQYKHFNASVSPIWPLNGVREGSILSLYAVNDEDGIIVKINPFISNSS